jgi:hypothetical protein
MTDTLPVILLRLRPKPATHGLETRNSEPETFLTFRPSRACGAWGARLSGVLTAEGCGRR